MDTSVQTQQHANGDLPVVSPPVDIYEITGEDRQGLALVADVPGARADGLTVRLDPGRNGHDVLFIEALASAGEGDQARSFRYRRAFVLNERVDQDNIRAELRHGELRIELPRAAEMRSRRIEVVEG